MLHGEAVLLEDFAGRRNNRRHLWSGRRVTHLLGAHPGSGCLTSLASTCVSTAAAHHLWLAGAPKTRFLLQNNDHFSQKTNGKTKNCFYSVSKQA